MAGLQVFTDEAKIQGVEERKRLRKFAHIIIFYLIPEFRPKHLGPWADFAVDDHERGFGGSSHSIHPSQRWPNVFLDHCGCFR
jgi:hypothetical protein